MKLLRRLFGLDFPDPVAGQVWRSRHSGRAIRVAGVRLSDCGKQWHISMQHETDGGRFNPVSMSCCMFPAQWRRMLRDEARQLMGGGLIEPTHPWPRVVNVNPAPTYPRPPAPPAPPTIPLGAILTDEQTRAALASICPKCITPTRRAVHECADYRWLQCSRCKAVTVLPAVGEKSGGAPCQ